MRAQQVAAALAGAPSAAAPRPKPFGARGSGAGVGLVGAVVAALPRLWGLGTQPVLYFDSGVYLGEGAFLASAAQRAVAAFADRQNVAQALGSGWHGRPSAGHRQARPRDPAGAVDARAGQDRRWRGRWCRRGRNRHGRGDVCARAAGLEPRVAFLAALLLAISGQHIVYSREPLVEADGLFFATLGALVYLRPTTWRGFSARACCMGWRSVATTACRMSPLVFAIVELGGWPGLRWLYRARRWRWPAGSCCRWRSSRRATWSRGRSVAPPAPRMEWLDYVQQLAAFSRMNPPDRVRFDQWPTYFVDIALMDGLAVLALCSLAIVVLLRRRENWTRANLLLAGSLLVPLVLYSVYSTGEVRMRHFSLALPWVMLAAALGARWLCGFFHRARDLALTIAWSRRLAALPRIVALDSPPIGMPARPGRSRRPARGRHQWAGAGVLYWRRSDQCTPAGSLRQYTGRLAATGRGVYDARGRHASRMCSPAS